MARLEREAGYAFHAQPFNPPWLLDAGRMTILAAEQMARSPRLYGAGMLWLLADLYQRLPEVGDLEKPRLVVFIDGAHMLFDGMPAPESACIFAASRLPICPPSSSGSCNTASSMPCEPSPRPI